MSRTSEFEWAGKRYVVGTDIGSDSATVVVRHVRGDGSFEVVAETVFSRADGSARGWEMSGAPPSDVLAAHEPKMVTVNLNSVGVGASDYHKIGEAIDAAVKAGRIRPVVRESSHLADALVYTATAAPVAALPDGLDGTALGSEEYCRCGCGQVGECDGGDD